MKLPSHILKYLNHRCVSRTAIKEYNIGYERHFKKYWITFPITDNNGKLLFKKLREDPLTGNSKMTDRRGVHRQLFRWSDLTGRGNMVLTEGEIDALSLISAGMPAITMTHGAMSFKKEWAELFDGYANLYICFDSDPAGTSSAKKTAIKLFSFPKNLFIINLPVKDVNDYIVSGLQINDLFTKYATKITEEYILQNKPRPRKIYDASYLAHRYHDEKSSVQRALNYPIERILGVERSDKNVRCPFHSDNRPSLCIKNNFAWCFACGYHANTIQLYMDLHHVTFREAVEKLS